MINFNNFILGEAGIEVESLEEATELIKVCDRNNIDHYLITPEYYEDEPYWYVVDGSLCTTKYYCDMADDVCSTWTYQQFVEEHS